MQPRMTLPDRCDMIPDEGTEESLPGESPRLLTAAGLLLITLTLALPARADSSERAPARVRDTLHRLVAERTFDRMLPDGWRLDQLVAEGDRVELEFVDKSGVAHGIELLPLSPETGKVAGRGQHSLYRFVRGADGARDQQVLLWAAGVVDTALGSDAPRSAVGASREPDTAGAPRVVAISLGILQCLIVLLAIVTAVSPSMAANPSRREGE